MEVSFNCTYCDHKWTRNVYSLSGMEEVCPKCKDKNVKYKELSKSKIDYYQGCRPFEEKKEELNDIDLNIYFDDGFRGGD